MSDMSASEKEDEAAPVEEALKKRAIRAPPAPGGPAGNADAGSRLRMVGAVGRGVDLGREPVVRDHWHDRLGHLHSRFRGGICPGIEQLKCGSKTYFVAEPPSFPLAVREGAVTGQVMEIDVSQLTTKTSYDNPHGARCERP